MRDVTSQISRFAAQLTFEDLPSVVIEQTKLFIADYYAACFAGYRINGCLNTKVLSLLEEMGGCQESSILFSRSKLPASNAAFINALYAHGADMDDGNRKAAGHIGTHVFSAVFALAEAIGATWKEVFVAVNVGYDVFNRVVGAAQPSLYNRGLHSTGIGGGLSCGAACARLLRLDAEGVYNAISLGAIQSSGLIIVDESGQGCKPINPANAARTGVFSAQLAQMGIQSSRNPLQSRKGWFNAFTGGTEIDESTLLQGMGKSFTISESYLKLYPTCRHTHCCIDAALDIRQKLLSERRKFTEIEKITIFIYASAIRSAGQIVYPSSAEEAKFSIHYCVAAAMARGKFGLEELNVQACPEARTLIPMVELVEDAKMEDREKGIRGARVYVLLKGGTAIESLIHIPRGEAQKPLSWEDLEKKLSNCSNGILDDAQVRALIEEIRCIEPDETFRHYPLRHMR